MIGTSSAATRTTNTAHSPIHSSSDTDKSTDHSGHVWPQIPPKSKRRPKHSVHWFRKGLRLTDNPALLRAIKRCDTWRCVFILDPWFARSSNQGINKWRYVVTIKIKLLSYSQRFYSKYETQNIQNTCFQVFASMFGRLGPVSKKAALSFICHTRSTSRCLTRSV